ncbi:alpha/beta-hydrolase [Thozetella sp. PMI_491]|nr:alpha/beta-hydrolase [Thozetella sp. PMI_491]
MAGSHGFWTYLRLKFFATIFRTFVKAISVFQFSSDQRTVLIPSRDPGRYITGHLHHPPSPSPGPVPVLVNWHGSGFVGFLMGSDAVYCATIARNSGIFVLDADYRKSPETPFPGALHDVEDVLRWVGSQSTQFDLTRVAVSGFSSGGTLALVAASGLRKTLEPLLNIAAVVGFYALVDLSTAPEARSAPKPNKPVPPILARFFAECYVPEKSQRRDPLVSPALAKASEFPPVVAIIACDGDDLAPEAMALADKLDDGRRHVVTKMLKDTPHAFDKGAKKGTYEWRMRDEAYRFVVETLRKAFE